MKKVERINTLMRYINNRAQFTISEIMDEFGISRSTAIRDIREVEAMGVPLTAEVGRSGGYFVMKNSMLPPVHFTDAEVKALFVALLATKNQQLPYLKSRLTLTEKLIGLLTSSQQEDLLVLNEVLLFSGTNPSDPELLEMSDIPHPNLESLIPLILTDRFLKLTTLEGVFYIYLKHLYQESGQWYIDAFDIEEQKTKTIAVAELEDSEVYEEINIIGRKQMISSSLQSEKPFNVILKLGPKAIAQYKKYHPFNIKIAYTSPFQLSGICRLSVELNNKEELEETQSWIHFLGKDVTLLSAPKEIVTLFQF